MLELCQFKHEYEENSEEHLDGAMETLNTDDKAYLKKNVNFSFTYNLSFSLTLMVKSGGFFV